MLNIVEAPPGGHPPPFGLVIITSSSPIGVTDPPWGGIMMVQLAKSYKSVNPIMGLSQTSSRNSGMVTDPQLSVAVATSIGIMEPHSRVRSSGQEMTGGVLS